MVKGSIYLVTDFDMAISAMNSNNKVLFVGELNRNIPEGFIVASVLLPPLESVSAEVDGNLEMAEQIYMHYLDTSEPCFGMFATLLVALYNGLNIVLYIDGGQDLSYINTLLKYFDMKYGLRIGTQATPFTYIPEFNPHTAVILYSYLDGFIDEYVLATNLPDVGILRIMANHPYLRCIEKLQMRFNLPPDLETIITHFHNYKNTILNYGAVLPGDMITLEEGE